MRSVRRLIRAGFALLAGLGLASLALQDPEPVRLGAGEHTYEWVSDWAKLPEGMSLGNTHGCVVVDSQDRIYLNTDSEHAVCVFDADGNFLRSFGADLGGGLHGMALVERDGEELLYLAHIGRHEVLLATLEGDILRTWSYPEASGVYESAEGYRPTSVAVSPDGGFYVADGYGSSWIHRYDAQGDYVSSFGGPGTELGKLRTPHGLWLDERGEEPLLLVADRENNRLQLFDLEGEGLSTVEGMLRRPCHMHPFENDLVVADLAGRVTILNGELELVEHLGDQPDPAKRAQNGIPVEDWKDGEFLAPHCANWDSKGNLYVTDWLAAGRISKLERVR